MQRVYKNNLKNIYRNTSNNKKQARRQNKNTKAET